MDAVLDSRAPVWPAGPVSPPRPPGPHAAVATTPPATVAMPNTLRLDETTVVIAVSLRRFLARPTAGREACREQVPSVGPKCNAVNSAWPVGARHDLTLLANSLAWV